jgi:membrane fusion protein, multidrug efflux system
MKLIKKLTFLYSSLTILFLTGCQPPPENKGLEYTYQVSKPLVKDMSLNDEYVCQIRAIQHIELRSLEKGYLQKIYVDEGQFVHQGQMLFQIKPNIYKADVQKSQAEVEFAKIELENNKALVEKDIISKSESAMSAAKLAKSEAELEMSKTHLGFTEIRAPFNGLVGKFGDIRTGSLLDEGELLTTLSDNHKMWVYFNVPEVQYLNYMKNKQTTSQTVQLQLANKEVYPEVGTQEIIESDFNNTSGNVALRATFNNPHSLLRHGETGNILWPKLIKRAIIIPQKSTFEILDKKFVLVVDKQGVLHEREVVVAEEAPNIFILKSGISADEMYLLEGQGKLYKGDKIKYKIIDPRSVIKNLDLYAN